MTIYGLTHPGAVRPVNQDAFQIFGDDPGTTVLGVVCDGMGGANAGDVASTLALDVFLKTLQSNPAEHWPKDPEPVLRDAIYQANAAVYRAAQENPEYDGMGTTIIAVLMQGTNAMLLNVGDSRAYLVNADGITRLTRDHSVVEDLVAQGSLTEEQARNHPQKNLITRVLGVERTVKADVYRYMLCKSDYLLLCSDGLVNSLTDQQIMQLILQGGDAKTASELLIQAALENEARDNVTAVVIAV